jgi:hypothetical protein
MLKIEVLRSDDDVTQIRVSGSNGRFAGAVNAYVSRGTLVHVAKDLDGFPKHVGDTRDVVLGAFGPRYAGGAVRLHFVCPDLAGHPRLDAEFEAEDHGPAFDGNPEYARVIIRFEVAAFDRFVSHLRTVGAGDAAGVAELRAVDSAV